MKTISENEFKTIKNNKQQNINKKQIKTNHKINLK